MQLDRLDSNPRQWTCGDSAVRCREQGRHTAMRGAGDSSLVAWVENRGSVCRPPSECWSSCRFSRCPRQLQSENGSMFQPTCTQSTRSTRTSREPRLLMVYVIEPGGQSPITCIDRAAKRPSRDPSLLQDVVHPGPQDSGDEPAQRTKTEAKSGGRSSRSCHPPLGKAVLQSVVLGLADDQPDLQAHPDLAGPEPLRSLFEPVLVVRLRHEPLGDAGG